MIRSTEKNCRPKLVCINHLSFLVSTNLCGTLFFLYKNIFYKNIEAEIREILRIF